MASYIVHLRIAEKLYNEIENISEKDFIIGNIAPDCDVIKTGNISQLPDKDISHFYTKRSDNLPDAELFYNEYIHNKTLDKEQYSFYMGYYCHLLIDLMWEELFDSLVDEYGTSVIKSPTYSKKGKTGILECMDLLFLNSNKDFRPYQVLKNNKMYINNYFNFFDKYGFYKKFVQIIDYYDCNGKYLDFINHDKIKIKIDNFVSETTKKIAGRLDHFWMDIPKAEEWKYIDLTVKNWAGDRKYNVETFSGKKYILEMANKTFIEVKQDEFNYAKSLGSIFVNKPKKFGFCNNKTLIYCIYEKYNTTYLSDIMHKISKEEQYKFGVETGKILKKIHDMYPAKDLDWKGEYSKKIAHIINMFNECDFSIENIDKIVRYINSCLQLLADRPQSLLHGDFQVENIAINLERKSIGIVSLNKYSYGDPWMDFVSISKSVPYSPEFACGQINGYFNNKVPDEFFRLLALYTACTELSNITWSLAYGEEKHAEAINTAYKIFYWYNYFTTYRPKWYKFSGKY